MIELKIEDIDNQIGIMIIKFYFEYCKSYFKQNFDLLWKYCEIKWLLQSVHKQRYSYNRNTSPNVAEEHNLTSQCPAVDILAFRSIISNQNEIHEHGKNSIGTPVLRGDATNYIVVATNSSQ